MYCCHNSLYMLPEDLCLKFSNVPGKEYGIWSQVEICCGTRFGPMECFNSELITKHNLKREKQETEPTVSVNNTECNWLSCINYACSKEQQNLLIFHWQGDIYYITCKHILANTELLVWCDWKSETTENEHLEMAVRGRRYDLSVTEILNLLIQEDLDSSGVDAVSSKSDVSSETMEIYNYHGISECEDENLLDTAQQPSCQWSTADIVPTIVDFSGDPGLKVLKQKILTKKALNSEHHEDESKDRISTIENQLQTEDHPSHGNSQGVDREVISDIRENSIKSTVSKVGGIKRKRHISPQKITASKLSNQSDILTSVNKLKKVSQLTASIVSQKRDMYSHFGDYVSSALREKGGQIAMLIIHEISNIIFKHMTGSSPNPSVPLHVSSASNPSFPYGSFSHGMLLDRPCKKRHNKIRQ